MDKFDNIVFENKNKDYGAFELRKRYLKSVSVGLIFSIIIFASISVFAFVRCLSNVNDAADYELQQEIAEYEQYNMLKNIDSFMVSKPPAKKLIKKQEDKTLVVVDSIKSETDTVKILKLPDENDSLITDGTISDTSRAGIPNGSEDGTIYTKVDEIPEFPGGLAALKLYLVKNTKYPEDAKKNTIKGIVQVQFVITKDGNVEKVSIKKGANEMLDVESIRVVKSFPKWKPAKRNGKSVNAWVVIPFNYQL